MALELDNKPINVSPERQQYNQVRLKYLALAEAAAVNFGASYHASFKNIDEVHEQCTALAYSSIREAVEVALQDIVKLGIYDVDNDAFAAFLDPYFSWPEDFAQIDDAYMAIVLKAEELDAYRTERRQSRGRWVGGGFGVSGAIKGAMQAGAMNMAGNLLHGTWNLAAKAASAAGDLVSKNALFNDPGTQAHLVASLHRAVFNVHLALVDTANTCKPGTYTDLVNDEDKLRAARLLQNIASRRIPQDALQDALLDAVRLDPYNENFYRLWLDSFGDQTGQLERLEAVFGLHVAGCAKQDLIATRRQTLDFSTPEACDQSLSSLEQYAASIGYAGFDKERTAILAEKRELEQRQRTVGGVSYETVEQVAEAKERLARTVRGTTYPTLAAADEARAQKIIGPGFYALLVLFPFVTPLFTLRKGYSRNLRLVAFAWLIVVAITVFINNRHTETSNVPTAAAPPQAVDARPAASAPPPAFAGPVAAATPADLPFVGRRIFNFDGGNGTEKSITISANGHATLESHGSSGKSVDFDGAFSNPLRVDKESALLFRGHAVFLMDGKNVKLGCRYTRLECATELDEETPDQQQAAAPLDLKSALADPRAIVCRFNEAEQTCSDIDSQDGRSYQKEEFVITKGYTALFREQTFDEPGTAATYLKLTVKSSSAVQ